ncbi:helix-turn-helix domain-containing protein [Oceanobacter antarcticus]|uniref:Helix-turn-helix domain-containing protein n=1 Tax=Oceanobacter antarcticus TaxID=3133425 RepID=A0ABW8NFR8_9GAMM
MRWCDDRDRQQIAALRRRFEQYRVAGLTDAPRSGHPRSINDDKVTEVINKTLPTKPANATHWSTTLMATAPD